MAIGQWKQRPLLFWVYRGFLATQLCGYYFISHEFWIPMKQPGFQWNGLVGKCLQVQLGEVVWCYLRYYSNYILLLISLACSKSRFFPVCWKPIIFSSPFRFSLRVAVGVWMVQGRETLYIQLYLRISVDFGMTGGWLGCLEHYPLLGKWLGPPPFISRLQ